VTAHRRAWVGAVSARLRASGPGGMPQGDQSSSLGRVLSSGIGEDGSAPTRRSRPSTRLKVRPPLHLSLETFRHDDGHLMIVMGRWRQETSGTAQGVSPPRGAWHSARPELPRLNGRNRRSARPDEPRVRPSTTWTPNAESLLISPDVNGGRLRWSRTWRAPGPRDGRAGSRRLRRNRDVRRSRHRFRDSTALAMLQEC